MPEPRNGGMPRIAGHGRLRASHADRDQVIDILKHAFVQGRLTKDEFDSRVGHALASRTHADLAVLTADLPAGPPSARSRPRPRRPAQRPAERPAERPANPTVRKGSQVIAATTVLTGAVWAGAWISNGDNQVLNALVMSFSFLWVGILFLVSSVMLESHLRGRPGQRPGRPLPPAQPVA